jgi:hypothetical protein
MKEKKTNIIIDPKHNTEKNFIDIVDMGFIEPTILETDYVFGGETKIGNEIVKPDGQWIDYVGEKEWQWKKFVKDGVTYMVETMSCPDFGTLNANEILHKFLYNEEINLSDRCLSIESGTTKQGNNPQNSAEALRKLGCCYEKDLPFDETCITWEAFHSPKPLTDDLKNKAESLLDRYEFLHEWVDTKNKQNLIDSLKRSPLGISVKAWKMRNGLYYKEAGETDNHWCVLIGYELNKCWYVFDSYDSFIKKLEWDYDFQWAKRYFLKKKVTDEELAIPNPEENNMKCYQNIIDGKVSPDLYFFTEGDKKFHWVPDMDMANKFWTKDQLLNRVQQVIPSDMIGETFYSKSNISVQIIKFVTDFFNRLRGKK